MAIEFHCDHCGKQVRAPDNAGGQHGQCPSCHQTVYIPTADGEIEPLTLAPVDEQFEREKERALRETRELTSRILHDREALSSERGGSRQPAPAAVTASEMQEIVVQYAAAMHEGKLAEAEALAVDIRRNLRLADDVVQRLLSDEIPHPRLSKIPRPLLNGFFRQLREHK